MLLVLCLLYISTHLPALTSLPVFADEAIYIRWAQLIVSDAQQYLFFPLNDGKTPLFIWFIALVHPLFNNPLMAGRVVSVCAGLVQVLAISLILKQLGASRRGILYGALSVIFLPYWFFHHRMALMDSWLTLFVTLSMGAVLALSSSKRQNLTLVASIAAGLAAAIATKVPAVLALPALFPLLFTEKRQTTQEYAQLIRSVLLSGVLLLIFLVPLALMPGFSQLFSRGSDFLFSLSEFLNGAWKGSIASVPTYFSYFLAYTSLGTFLLLAYGLLATQTHRRKIILLWLGGMLFCVPIALLGKVVYPRYLLPALPFFTLAAALAFDELSHKVLKYEKITKAVVAPWLLFFVVVTQSAITSFEFAVRSYLAPDTIPFVSADKTQYLTEWSSGHGTQETVLFISELAQKKRVAVATEGYFGTLPDALLMYLYGADVHNLWVEGIGQPVQGIPAQFSSHAAAFDQALLVVNSHRMLLQLSPEKKLKEYCRPFAAPCLQIWDITDLVKSAPVQ